MNGIEEVVKKYLQKTICRRCTEKEDCSFDIDKDCPNVFKNNLTVATLGAKWALQHQWVEVKERLPDKEELVLCEMKSNRAVVSGYISLNEKGIPQVSTDPSFEFADYAYYEPIRWMKKPEN